MNDTAPPDVSISMSTHIGDDATETDDLTPTEYGIHGRLRRALWKRGGVLDGDRARLRRLVGAETDADVAALDSVVSRLWVATEDGKIVHPPTMAGIDRARAKKASYVARGKEGGRGHRKAGGKLGESSAKAEGKAGTKTPPPPPPPPPSPAPPPTPTPTPEETEIAPAGGPAGPVGVLKLVVPEARKPPKPDSSYSDSFVRFWAAWPKKVAKEDAWHVWQTKRCEQHLDAILLALAWQVKSGKWTEAGGKYITHPDKYLRGKRWQDDPSGYTSATSQRADGRPGEQPSYSICALCDVNPCQCGAFSRASNQEGGSQ